MHCCLVFFPFLCWVKFCIGCFRQVFFFFSFQRQNKWPLVGLDRQSSYAVTIAWEFAKMDSALVVLDEWSSYRGGRLNRFDFNCKFLLLIQQNFVMIFPPNSPFISPITLLFFLQAMVYLIYNLEYQTLFQHPLQ